MSRRKNFTSGSGVHDPNEVIRQHLREDPQWTHFSEGLTDRAWDVIDTHAADVFKKHEKFPLDCGEVSSTWQKRFEKAGIPAKLVDGNFVGGLKDMQGLTHLPTSTEHVWLEVDGGIFDPTASQYANRVPEFKREHYKK